MMKKKLLTVAFLMLVNLTASNPDFEESISTRDFPINVYEFFHLKLGDYSRYSEEIKSRAEKIPNITYTSDDFRSILEKVPPLQDKQKRAQEAHEGLLAYMRSPENSEEMHEIGQHGQLANFPWIHQEGVGYRHLNENEEGECVRISPYQRLIIELAREIDQNGVVAADIWGQHKIDVFKLFGMLPKEALSEINTGRLSKMVNPPSSINSKKQQLIDMLRYVT